MVSIHASNFQYDIRIICRQENYGLMLPQNSLRLAAMTDLMDFDNLVTRVGQRLGTLPDHRTGENTRYSLECLFSLLAFRLHTVLEPVDANYHLLRQALRVRRIFFSHIETLTRYFYFDSWHQLLHFMIKQLKLNPNPDTS